MNNNNNNKRKQIIQWEIPHLICILKKQYNINIMYLNTSHKFSKEEPWFVFNNKIGFPIFIGEEFFGLLICLGSLNSFKAREIKIHMDRYLIKQKISKIQKPSLNVLNKLKRYTYPVLIRQKNKKDRFKIAYKLYLKTRCFAFLKTEDFNWKHGVFHELEGVFIYIPCFYKLSTKQKNILNLAILHKSLSCFLVVGVKQTHKLPAELNNSFYIS